MVDKSELDVLQAVLIDELSVDNELLLGMRNTLTSQALHSTYLGVLGMEFLSKPEKECPQDGGKQSNMSKHEHQVLNNEENQELVEQPVQSTRVKELTKRAKRNQHVDTMMTSIDFKAQFHMTKSTFEKLCEEMIAHMTQERGLSVEIKFLSTLWLLVNQESYRNVAERFSMCKGSLHMTVLSVCNAVTSSMEEYIKFPESQRQLESVRNSFRRRCGIPGVIGVIDATHIGIPSSKAEGRGTYVNKNGTSSMVLQVVCDGNLRFTDVCTGWPGSAFDAWIYQNSPLSNRLNELPKDYCLLGDLAYPLSEKLLVPFHDDGYLDNIRRNFNRCHYCGWIEVKRAIGLLKHRFKRLKFLGMSKEKEIPVVVASCCVLHNFILMHETEDSVDYIPDEWLAKDDSSTGEGYMVDSNEAEWKRLEVAQSLV